MENDNKKMSILVKKRNIKNIVIAIVASIILMYCTVSTKDNFYDIALRIIVIFQVFYCMIKGLRCKELFNPYYLFLIVPLSLVMYSENISPIYLKHLNIDTWIIAIINITVFLLALKYCFRKTTKTIKTNQLYSSQKFCVVSALILFAIGKFPFLLKKIVGVDIPFGGIISFFSFAAITYVMKSKNKMWIMVITGLNLFMLILSGFNKTSILFLVMTYLVSYEKYYVKNKYQRKKMIISLACFGALFLFVIFPMKDFLSRGGNSVLDFTVNDLYTSADYYGDRISWSGNRLLMMPYMYLVQAWNNLQYVMETQNFRTHGLWIMKPILGYLQIDTLFEANYELIPYSSFNTYTYIAVLFKDLGMYGSILGSFFLGAFVKYVYKFKYLQSDNPADLVCYALTACAVFEMFFSNHFLQQSYPFTIIILMWLYQKIIVPIFVRRKNI